MHIRGLVRMSGLVFFIIALAMQSVDSNLQRSSKGHSPQLMAWADPMDLNVTWHCNRPWPTQSMLLTLYVPDAATRNQPDRHKWNWSSGTTEWESIFLHGAMMYWPWKKAQTKLLLLVDAEMRDTAELRHDVLDVLDKYQRQLGALFPPTQVLYNDPIQGAYHSGYGRMQYLGFVADKFVQDEFVVFVDSDTLFHTYVDREDLFEHGKPVIHGRHSFYNYFVHALRTVGALGIKEPFSCMSYFPVVIRTADLPLIREAIRKHRNTSTFEEAYFSFTKEHPGAQYNIMCTWLYFNRHDDYVWRLKDHLPKWNGLTDPQVPDYMWPGKSLFGGELSNSNISAPYLSDHITYVSLPEKHIDWTHGKHMEVATHIATHSVCFFQTQYPSFYLGTQPSKMSLDILDFYHKQCADFRKKNEFNEWWFRFEQQLLLDAFSAEQKRAVVRARNNRVSRCRHTYILI